MTEQGSAPLWRRALVPRLRAAGLALPLIAFVTVTFVGPMASLQVKSVYDPEVAGALPETMTALERWVLPFLVLQLYSVIRSIPPAYMNAAASLGANPIQALRRVYWPQSLPGVGAGCLLTFILAIGYYITPALVGGQSGQLISNMIAYHVQTSLNWGLAAALAALLLAGVTALYAIYDRLVGIDRIGLG